MDAHVFSFFACRGSSLHWLTPLPVMIPYSAHACKWATRSDFASSFSFREEKGTVLLFFLEEKKQKKIICRICFCASLYILRNPVAQNGRLTYEPAVFLFQAGCARKRLLSEIPPQPLRLLFLFFKKRNRSPSFLFRRKEAKESHLPDLLLRFSLHFAQSCCAKRTAHIRAVRFFVASWMCGKTPSVRNAPPQPLRLLFLFFKKRNRPLLFFLEEKKQKKIICGTGFPAAPAAFAGLQHKNGQLACERPFFRSGQDVRKRLFYAYYPQPLRLLFLFFKKRNRSPSFLFRRKEAKENHLPDLLLRFSLHFAQSCCAKRTAHIRDGRFFVASWMCGKPPSVRNAPPQPLCLLFLFFKKRNRPLKEIVPPSKLHEKAGRSF